MKLKTSVKNSDKFYLILSMRIYKKCRIFKGSKKGQKPTLNSPWFVYYYFNENYNDLTLKPKWVRFRVKGDINREDTIEGRNFAASIVAEGLNELLAGGYNPFHDKETNLKKYRKIEMTLSEGLDWAYDRKSKNWAHKTKIDLKSNLKKFKTIAGKLGMLELDIRVFDRLMMRQVLDEMVTMSNLGAHAYLKFKSNIGNLFEELKGWNKIDFNPCDFKVALKKPKPKAKRLLTDQDRQRIKETVINHNPNFYSYLMVINMTALRPVEILRLKVGDIQDGKIILRSEDAKDKEDRVIIIPKALEKYLDLNCPKDWYLFGNEFKPQQRNKPMSRDKATHLWQELIIKGLGIDFKMYHLKHLGLTSMRQKGIDPEIVQYLAGHSSYDMTNKHYIIHDRPEVIEVLRNLEDSF